MNNHNLSLFLYILAFGAVKTDRPRAASRSGETLLGWRRSQPSQPVHCATNPNPPNQRAWPSPARALH